MKVFQKVLSLFVFAFVYPTSAVTDDFKKELINKFVPIVILDSRDITGSGIQIEPEPLNIVIDNAEYKVLLTSFNGSTLISNHGTGGKDILKKLLPTGRLYWTNGSSKVLTNSQDCLVNSDNSCKEPLYKMTNYLSSPTNCNSHPFCCGGCGLYGDPYYQFFDWPGDTPSEWKNKYDQCSANYSPTVYSTFFENTNYYVIQYYYFTPFNDFSNDHEGDWENVNIYIDKNNLNSISKIDYLFHHKYVPLDKSSGKFDLIEGHPVLYTGGYANYLGMSGPGSHGVFPYPGEYSDVESGCPESVDGKGKVLLSKDFTVKYMLDDKGSDPFYYPVFWGKSADLGWVDDVCAMFVWTSGCASATFQKPPMSRSFSGRWKKVAEEINANIEEVKKYTNLPGRSNIQGFECAINKVYSKRIIPIINLLLE